MLMNRRSSFVLVFCVLWFAIISSGAELHPREDVWGRGPLVKKDKRTSLVTTEYGEISAVRVDDDIDGSYLLHFFTLDPNSLFLPALLHADMIFYVHTGSGKISWTEEGDLESTELSRGDVYTLKQGSVFFIRSNLQTETERQKLRIHAIFTNSYNGLQVPLTSPYSSIRDMIIGFDRKVLQAAFRVPEDVIEELLNGTEQPAIIHGVSKAKGTRSWEMEVEFVRGLLRSRSYNIFDLNKNKKKSDARAYNLFKEDKDFENRNGWSTTVTRKKLSALKGSHIGVFMVNLTGGSMMGPHWNPIASEIGVVLEGRGMVRTVYSSISNETGCNNSRFDVEEGDVFAVSRFHPMAQMAFNNGTFVFMGFSTSSKKNHPQFLAGQASVFRTLDRDVLAMSFNVTNTTMDQLLSAEGDSVILSCVSCAEEEFSVMEEEIEREREAEREREEEAMREREEERRREEEAARKREEEEARRQEEEKRRQEEEEERKRQEEEERRQEEEEEEEKRRKEEEERRKEEEEEEEERRRREEEEEKRRQEEEEKQKEEEEEATREEEEKRRQEQEQERKRREEEAARREEEEARRQEEEGRQRAQEQEEARRKEEEVRWRQQEQEEERRREEEEAREREEEEARREREEEEARKEEEARQREKEEERRREEEETRREEEEARQREEEEEARREQEAKQREKEEEEEEEAARRQEEERRRIEQEEEEAARRREEKARRREEEEGRGGRSEEERAAEEERRMEEDVRREQEATRQRRRRKKNKVEKRFETCGK